MISTNKVRNTVLFFLNKNNRGFLTPLEYDAYSEMAQLSIFEELFYDYAKWIYDKTNRRANSGFSDIPKNIKEQIETFLTYSTQLNLVYSPTLNVWQFSNTDYYRGYKMNVVFGNKIVDCELVDSTVINYIINSKKTQPTFLHPIYENRNGDYRIYPTLPVNYYPELLYIRKPKQPKWTYVDNGGNPMYNATSPDLQDFELNESLFEKLVVKILGYAGISIREAEVVQVANNEEMKINQKES
jgi:hypothetical protein